jgi:hypothetical protein
MVAAAADDLRSAELFGLCNCPVRLGVSLSEMLGEREGPQNSGL